VLEHLFPSDEMIPDPVHYEAEYKQFPVIKSAMFGEQL